MSEQGATGTGTDVTGAVDPSPADSVRAVAVRAKEAAFELASLPRGVKDAALLGPSFFLVLLSAGIIVGGFRATARGSSEVPPSALPQNGQCVISGP